MVPTALRTPSRAGSGSSRLTGRPSPGKVDPGVPSMSGREWCIGGEDPLRLEASQIRIRGSPFGRAAHMGQVKRGFGSWQRRPEQEMGLGKAPAEALRREGKSWH